MNSQCELRPATRSAAEIPFGYCHCGCGQKTKVSQQTDANRGRVRGQPFRYLQGHAPRKHHVTIAYDPKIGKGFCHCGCGGKTSPAPYTQASRGMISGEPMLYLTGHHQRPKTPPYIVDPETGCWVWQWFSDTKGYGKKRDGDRAESAHRLFYQERHGAIPDGMELDHKCRNRACVNPDHLEPVTTLENIRRGLVPVIDIDIARQIKADLRKMRQCEVAEKHNVSYQIVHSISHGKTWRDA